MIFKVKSIDGNIDSFYNMCFGCKECSKEIPCCAFKMMSRSRLFETRRASLEDGVNWTIDPEPYVLNMDNIIYIKIVDQNFVAEYDKQKEEVQQEPKIKQEIVEKPKKETSKNKKTLKKKSKDKRK